MCLPWAIMSAGWEHWRRETAGLLAQVGCHSLLSPWAPESELATGMASISWQSNHAQTLSRFNPSHPRLERQSSGEWKSEVSLCQHDVQPAVQDLNIKKKHLLYSTPAKQVHAAQTGGGSVFAYREMSPEQQCGNKCTNKADLCCCQKSEEASEPDHIFTNPMESYRFTSAWERQTSWKTFLHLEKECKVGKTHRHKSHISKNSIVTQRGASHHNLRRPGWCLCSGQYVLTVYVLGDEVICVGCVHNLKVFSQLSSVTSGPISTAFLSL